jgi:hypothetical protein
MARNETRHFRDHFAERAHLRAGAGCWHALANAAVASALVVALVVSAFALLDAVFSSPASNLARQSPAALEWRHASTDPLQ